MTFWRSWGQETYTDLGFWRLKISTGSLICTQVCHSNAPSKAKDVRIFVLKSPEDVSAHGLDARTVTSQSQIIVWKKNGTTIWKNLKECGFLDLFVEQQWKPKHWNGEIFRTLGNLANHQVAVDMGFFFGAKSLTTKKTEGQQNHMAVFSSFCLAKQLNRDRFTVSKFSDMTISSFLNRSVSGFLASTVPIRAAVTKNCGWEVARKWREVVCIRGTSNCRDFSLLDEFPVKRSLSYILLHFCRKMWLKLLLTLPNTAPKSKICNIS